MFQPAWFLDEQKVCLCQLSRWMGELLSAFLAETHSVSWRAELLWSCFISLLCWAGFSQLVAGNTLLIIQQSVLQSVSLWLQAMGFLRGHLLWQESSPGLPGPQGSCLITHIWIHCTPCVSKLGQPDRKNCLWSAVRATQNPVVMFFHSVGQHSWGISHQPSLTISFFLSRRSPLSLSWHWHILLAENRWALNRANDRLVT